MPITKGSTFEEALPVINGNFSHLDLEAVTKTFSQPGGNAIIQGKLPYDGGYGMLIYDSDGLARILIGLAPGDARPGIWVSADGVDVIDELSQ